MVSGLNVAKLSLHRRRSSAQDLRNRYPSVLQASIVLRLLASIRVPFVDVVQDSDEKMLDVGCC